MAAQTSKWRDILDLISKLSVALIVPVLIASFTWVKTTEARIAVVEARQTDIVKALNDIAHRDQVIFAQSLRRCIPILHPHPRVSRNLIEKTHRGAQRLCFQAPSICHRTVFTAHRSPVHQQ